VLSDARGSTTDASDADDVPEHTLLRGKCRRCRLCPCMVVAVPDAHDTTGRLPALGISFQSLHTDFRTLFEATNSNLRVA
jgi:hypothetical protein